MKKFAFILLLLISTFYSQAQDYQISFTGTGASTTVGTVTVENLTQGKSITIGGTEVLHLVKIVTGLDPILNQNKALLIFPNPTKDKSTMEFVATTSGKANIELFDISGKRIVTEQASLPIGTNSFQISGLGSGIFTVRISSEAYTYTGKLVSNGAPNSNFKISYFGNKSIPTAENKLKSANDEKAMQYTTGDRLKITGKSGNYSTVVVDVPTQNKTILFNFVACTDADGNNYPIVKIGTQIWMGENLKTTKYNNGEPIPNVTVNAEWYNLNGPGYCWYDNNVANKNTYGALYNWHTVNTGKLAPTGWHVPTDAEWTTLINYLGGESMASGKLKESGTSHWQSPNTGATNQSGFTALPGGYRSNNGTFSSVGNFGDWWSSTEGNTRDAWNLNLVYFSNNAYRGLSFKICGFSVRCIKD